MLLCFAEQWLPRVHVAVKPFQSIFEVKGVRINILSRELHSFQMVTKGRGAQSYCTNVIFLSRFHPRHPGFIQAQVLSSCEHLSRTSVCALLADAAFQVNWKEAHFFCTATANWPECLVSDLLIAENDLERVQDVCGLASS